jgi:SAM-dependent methyltransferase
LLLVIYSRARPRLPLLAIPADERYLVVAFTIAIHSLGPATFDRFPAVRARFAPRRPSDGGIERRYRRVAGAIAIPFISGGSSVRVLEELVERRVVGHDPSLDRQRLRRAGGFGSCQFFPRLFPSAVVSHPMTDWDERYSEGDYPAAPDPSPVLRDHVHAFPDGRALDVAAGTGRNALFLAEHGYAVDALDRSRVGLEIAHETAVERGIEDRLECIQADAEEYAFPRETYDVIAISFHRFVDRLPDIHAALAPGGVFFYEIHLRTTDDAPSGPSTDRYRFASNELLRACLGLTVIHYEEKVYERDEDRDSALATILARKSTGDAQSYPHVGDRR